MDSSDNPLRLEQTPVSFSTRTKATEEPEAFVDADKAADFLHVRRRRILELARAREIPAYPLGHGKRRVWRFRLSELACAIQARINCLRQSPAPK